MPAFLAPLVALLVLAAVLLLLVHLQQHLSKRRAVAHHDEFRSFLAQLERVTEKVNGLESLVPFVLAEKKIVDLYESDLRAFETVLQASRNVDQFGYTPDTIKRLSFLARSCETRVDATYYLVKGNIETRQKVLRETWKLLFAGKAPAKGCYFCSRPFERKTFKAVRTQIQGVGIRVWGCEVCRKELEETTSAKVLHFLIKGQPVHWEFVADYVPAKDYWALNEKKVVYKRPKLELIRFDE